MYACMCVRTYMPVDVREQLSGVSSRIFICEAESLDSATVLVILDSKLWFLQSILPLSPVSFPRLLVANLRHNTEF